jgi:hypothetical protein
MDVNGFLRSSFGAIRYKALNPGCPRSSDNGISNGRLTGSPDREEMTAAYSIS